MKQILQMVLFVALMAGLVGAVVWKDGQVTGTLDTCLMDVPNQLKTIRGIQYYRLALLKSSGNIGGDERPKGWEIYADLDVANCVTKYGVFPNCYVEKTEDLRETNISCLKVAILEVNEQYETIRISLISAGFGDGVSPNKISKESNYCEEPLSEIEPSLGRDFAYEHCRLIMANVRHGQARFVQLMRSGQ